MKTNPPTDDDQKSGWFEKPENVRKLWIGFLVACGFFMILDLVLVVIAFDKHPYFKWQKWPALYAVTGFVACVIFALGAGYGLRPLLKRGENFYDDETSENKDDTDSSESHHSPNHDDETRTDSDA